MVQPADEHPQEVPETRMIFTKRGNQKLVHQGFAYTLKHTAQDGKQHWRCDQRDKNKCKATLARQELNNGEVQITLEKEHNHLPEPDRVAAEELRGNIKQAALQQPASSTAKLVSDALAPMPHEALPLVGGNTQLKWAAWNARKQDRAKRMRR